MDLKSYLKEIEQFLITYLNDCHCNGYVLGLSGGVDSSLVAALTANAVGKDKITCIIIPIDSDISDENDAVKLCKLFNLKYQIIDGSSAYHELEKQFIKNHESISLSVGGNLKARIRMSILYAYAQIHNCLVLGTDNACERYTGYFTKYGDGGVDVLPIVYLTKGEVVEAAKLYNVPTYLAERIPSAGLFVGQTDEKEMGILYKDLDNYLLGNKIDEETKTKIERLHCISEHKRKDIPTPKPFVRG